MSRDIHGDGTTMSSVHINQAQAGITIYDQVHADDDHVQEQDNRVQLLAMEELVPISQTLITPTLARLFNLAAPSTDHNEQLLRPLPEERSLVHPHHEQHLKHVAIHAIGEKGDVQVSAEDRPQHAADSLKMMMMMMGSFMDPARGPAPTHPQNRPHVDASLIHSYIDPNDSIDDCAEGFGTNHVADRENSSNSGDGGAGSAGGGAGGSGSGSGGARTLKRPRLVWTPQLHKRFVDAVSHLGIKNAVPKTIMQLMNVEGLTRENVASHLQKYRLYLRRVQQGNLFSSCNGAAGPSSRSILSPAGQLVEHHHHQLNGGAPLSPGAASSDHQLFSSSFPALQAALQDQYISSPNHQRRSASAASKSINPLIHGHSLFLHQAHQQLKPAAKAPPFTQQHLNTHLYNAITVDISPAKRRSPWLSPQASMDMSSPHHIGSPLDRAASSSKASSPPKRALTLFPH